ncbi:MAG TPA: MFS transporter, partial [Chloroflexota bacterium]|nr:MFS transporter [Chloroflexota bacterium]
MALTFCPAWLNRDLFLLFAARGLRSLTQGYLAVIVPLYLALLGYDAIQLGLLFSASAFGGALVAGAVGFLADSYGRRNLLILMALLVSAGAVVFALTGTFWVLLVAAALSTFGRGGAGSGGASGPYYVAEEALIAEHVDDQYRTSAFGLVSFVGVLAGAIGSLVAVIPDLLHASVQMSVIFGDRLIFGFTALCGVLMAAAVLPVQESRRGTSPIKPVGPSARVPLSSDSWDLVLKFMATSASNGMALG